jgi:ABC-2 type transport system permease protein
MKMLAGIIKKEILEITRDVQSLSLLILMPAIFILVMSLSMQSLFQPGSSFKIKIIVADLDKSVESVKFLDILRKTQNYLITESKAVSSEEAVMDGITNGDYNFGLVINKNFAASIREFGRAPRTMPMTMYIEPAIQTSIQMGVKNQLVIEYLKLRTGTFFEKNNALLSYVGFPKDSFFPSIDTMISTQYALKNRRETVMPNAAQQSVPAWLVFSMYFIVMPISLIFHTEKNNGTLSRMRSINIKSRYLIAGKIVSYYIISMVQVASMLCVGRFLVPLLGGDTIQFGSSPAGLLLIASCVGVNSISYGLFISALSKNTQMAGSLGSILIIIFSAIGGIMIPKFVMPAVMQNLSILSPLSWGLEGFLDIMLRNGTVTDILPVCSLLLVTSGIMLAGTGILLKKKIF